MKAMIFKRLREEIVSIRARDPAAHSFLEVLLCYPGLHALAIYRIAHVLWLRGFRVSGRFLSHLAKVYTGIEIHPGAVIGDRVFIDHGTGVVIGETAIVGDDVTLYHGVTLGGTSLHKGKRHPTLKNGVIVGSGAQILGPVTVGAEARVGANAVVLTDVPPGVTMVGIPARMVMRRGEGVIAEHDFCAYGLPSEDLPDPVARVLESLRAEISLLSQRVEDLEQLPASDQEIIQPPVHKSPTPPHMGIVAQGDDGPEEAESGQQPEAKPLEIAGVG